MAFYFIKGRVTGQRSDDDDEFYDVFESLEDPDTAFDTYVTAKRDRRGRVPVEVDVYTFNKV